MPEDRKALHVYLSDDAHAAIHDFAAEEGCSVSGLIEVIGRGLADTGDDGEAHLEVGGMGMSGVVKAARKVDAGRRRRGGARA